MPDKSMNTNNDKNILPKGNEVFLHIYDISNGMAAAFSKSLLGIQVDGIWHTSIEVFGKEYFYQNGLKQEEVGKSVFGSSKESISLGFTDCTEETFNDFFENSKYTWTSENYDLFENNCNNFSNMVACFLVDKNIPNYILEVPEKIKKLGIFTRNNNFN